MLSTDAALPVSTSPTRVVAAAGPGLSADLLAAADAAQAPETADFAQLLALNMPEAAGPAATPATLAVTSGPALTSAPQLLEAAEQDAAILPVDGKPGKAAGKTLPVALPALPAPAASAPTVDGEVAATFNGARAAPFADEESKDAAMADAFPLALPANLPVVAAKQSPVEAVAAASVGGDPAPRAAPAIPDGLALNTLKAAPGTVDLAAEIQPAEAAVPATPASPGPVIAQALASLRLVAGDKSPAGPSLPGHDLAASVAAASIVLQPAAAPIPAAAPSLPAAPHAAAFEVNSAAPVRADTKPAKAAPQTLQPADSAAAATQPSASRDLLVAPVLPVVAADLVMPLAAPAQPAPAQPAPAQPAPAQAVLAAPQTTAPATTDVAGLIDRLVEARDAAGMQSGAAATIGATLAHAEFGRVSMQFRQDDGALSVSMASSDPGFAPAVQMAATAPGTAANEDRGSTARQDQQQAGASANQNAGQNATGSQTQAQTQSQSQSQARPATSRGNGQSGADEDLRPPAADPRRADGSIYA